LFEGVLEWGRVVKELEAAGGEFDAFSAASRHLKNICTMRNKRNVSTDPH
jgi:hypothetical protein